MTPQALGMLGGGQLGRMFVHAAQCLGWRVVVLDPDADSPAGRAADTHLCARYDDVAALDELARRCLAVSTEFENVPAASLEHLAQRCRVAPAAAAVRVTQHRGREKAWFAQAGVPCAPHAVVDSDEAIAHLPPTLFPAIAKTAELGYDGKGQRRVADAAAVRQAWTDFGRVTLVVEKALDLRVELSVVVARDSAGRMVELPVQQNLHRDGILAVTQVPAPDVDPARAAEAVACARRLAEALGYVGVLCVEFFVLADGSLCANEMAPRPHNSGHYSLEACDLSQFELQARVLAGWPLRPPRLESAAVMLNLLGDLWRAADGSLREPDWAAVLALPGAHLHLYGKAEPRPGRKMGHLTLTAPDPVAARAMALQAARRLGLPAF